VTFTVTYTPGGASVAALTATPSTLTGTNQLTAVSGALAEANVTLSTTSTAAIGFSTTSSAGWLTVQPAANGSTSASTPATLSFTASSAGLSPGSYTGYATVFYGTNQTLTIGVSFVVTATAVNFAPNTLAWTYESSSVVPIRRPDDHPHDTKLRCLHRPGHLSCRLDGHQLAADKRFEHCLQSDQRQFDFG
jgi:hypothetical protein